MKRLRDCGLWTAEGRFKKFTVRSPGNSKTAFACALQKRQAPSRTCCDLFLSACLRSMALHHWTLVSGAPAVLLARKDATNGPTRQYHCVARSTWCVCASVRWDSRGPYSRTGNACLRQKERTNHLSHILEWLKLFCLLSRWLKLFVCSLECAPHGARRDREAFEQELEKRSL